MNEIPDLNTGRSSILRRLRSRWLTRRKLRYALLGVAALMTVLALVYARVNVHGKSEWKHHKDEMAAKGETLDWFAFVPAPVPDDQNIFKAPKMWEWFGDNRGLLDAPMDRPIRNEFADRLTDPRSTAEIKTTSEASDYLTWSDQFQEEFNTISNAFKRPYARSVSNYSQAFAISFPNIAALRAVVKVLVQRAKCHLLLDQPEKAWQELALLNGMRRLVEGQGKFITTEGDWIRREGARHSLVIIASGLERHAWQEPQLVELQQQLKDSDFIALHADALRCGRALLVSSLETAASDDSNLYRAAFLAGGNNFWSRFKNHPELLLMRFAPRGAMYERATGMSTTFQKQIDALTPANGVIRPGDVSKAFKNWKRAQDGLPILIRTQTLFNEGQVACALERYRLAQGTYPETIDALVPRFIEKLPRDLVNGQPLIYRRTDDGNFALYSVGWNEKDDGGRSTSTPGRPDSIREGDWLWKDASKP